MEAVARFSIYRFRKGEPSGGPRGLIRDTQLKKSHRNQIMDRLRVPVSYGHRRTTSNSSVSSCDSGSSLEYMPSSGRRSSAGSISSSILLRSPSPHSGALKIQNQPEYQFLMRDIKDNKEGTATSRSRTTSIKSSSSSSNPYRNMRTPVVQKPKRRVTFIDPNDEEESDDREDGESSEKTHGKGRVRSMSPPPTWPSPPPKPAPRTSLRRPSSATPVLASRRGSTSSLSAPPVLPKTRPKTAPVRRDSISSLSSSCNKIPRPGSGGDKNKFDADRDFPEGMGSMSLAGVHNVTMHLQDLQNPGRLITVTMSYSAAAAHNSRIFSDGIVRSNKKREKAMGMLIKEIERRLGTQYRKRAERESQRQEEEERENKRREEDMYDRGTKGSKSQEEDALQRRDVSLLTVTDVKQLRRKRITRQSRTSSSVYSLVQKRKSIYSEHAVV